VVSETIGCARSRRTASRSSAALIQRVEKDMMGLYEEP
jgi:hypothetical protein